MSEKQAADLDGVQATLLLPLWGRAQESLSDNPILYDPLAVSIAHSLPSDLSMLFERLDRISRESWIARAVYFDSKAASFLQLHPNGTIVNAGCGLDTTFERVDNGRVRWFDLDLPEVIGVRRKYIQENDRRRFVANSLLLEDWLDEIPASGPTLFIVAGVIYYFTETEIRAMFARLTDHFGQIELVFDYCSDLGLKLANKRILEQTEMDESARLKWSANSVREIVQLHHNLQVLDNTKLFRNHRSHAPFRQRIGFLFSDMMRIMSLAHIKLMAGNGA